MEKKSKRRIDVMVSSTTKDLAEHRLQVRDAIHRLRWTALAMEYDEAKPRDDAISYSLKLVDDAEVYLGIIGVRCGYDPDDAARNPDKVSITELEYRRAVERGIPILIFVMDMEKHDIPAYFTADEKDSKRRKLKKFRDGVEGKHIVSKFTSAEDLRGKVLQSLYELRDSDFSDDEFIDETPPVSAKVLPKPPEFYADPPYRLTTEFIGRRDELRQLDAWATSDDAMMLVEAIGGMGKSAVTWQWVQDHKTDFDGVMWWSFYESGATMAAFVRHALAYITQQDPDALKSNDMKENFRQLRLALSKGRYLLVLDGLERVLVAYHRWNAAQMRDDTVEEAESIIKDRQIRECTDPKDDDVLEGLLTCGRTKILISTRLLPLALEDRTGDLSDGVAHIHLNGLHPNDALALIRHSGVTVDDTRQFEAFIETFGRHSLLVMLVAGKIKDFRRAHKDFDRWYELEGRHLTLSAYDLKQRQSQILQYALLDLSAEAMTFLSQIAAFGDAVKYDVLSLFNPYVRPAPEPVSEPNHWFEEIMRDGADTEEEKQKWQQKIDDANTAYQNYLKAQADYETYPKSSEYRQGLTQFDRLLTELEERGLLRWDRDKDVYDMHPVVRGTAFDRLEDDTRVITFERIRGHFERQTEDIKNAKEVTDLTNTIGVYRTLVGAGKWDEAARFFENRLLDKLKDHIAAYYTVIELLTPLFPDGTDTLPRLNDAFLKSSIITTLANMFFLIGRNDEALNQYGLTLKLWLDSDDGANLIYGLLNYASPLRQANQLALSERVRETGLELAQATKDQSKIIRSTIFLLSN